MPSRLHSPPPIPVFGWLRFQQHKENARRRGIPFVLSPAEWWDWWQTDSRWRRRGMGKNGLVMARNNDVGPYSLDNIYCTTHSGNFKDIPKSKRRRAKAG